MRSGFVSTVLGLARMAVAWGGELLFFDGQRVQRLGHLAPILQPGGDPGGATALATGDGDFGEPAAARRSAAAVFCALAGVAAFAHRRAATALSIDDGVWSIFSGSGGALGVCESESYEAEAAMRLESLVEHPIVQENGYRVLAFEDGRPCQPRSVGAVDDVARPFARAGRGAVSWHARPRTLCAGTSVLHRLGLRAIVLSGGCVMNRVFTESLCAAFSRHGIAVHLPVRLPPNDGGLSLGQVYAHALGLFAQRD